MRQPMPRRTILIATLLVLAVATACAGYAYGNRARGFKVRAYGAARAHVVSYQSGALADGFVLLAGDSHAELAVPDAPSCGRRLLNAGVSGAKADDYADFLAHAALAHRASVAVVTLGTNHLLRKRNPAGAAAAAAYEADLAAVVSRLSGMADRVVVAAVPPVAPALDKFVDRAGVEALTRVQAAVCARLGCETVDPYATYRDADFGTARSGASHDGLHLGEYATAYRAIDGLLCR